MSKYAGDWGIQLVVSKANMQAIGNSSILLARAEMQMLGNSSFFLAGVKMQALVKSLRGALTNSRLRVQ